MTHSVYALLDENGQEFYVGKSLNPSRRLKGHVYFARYAGQNYPVCCKIRKMLRLGHEVGLRILEENILDSQIDERECFWIRSLREKGVRLKNVANGGEGGKGQTPETIEKARLKRVGQRLSEVTRQKISAARKGCTFSPQHRQNLSRAWQDRVVTEATRRKMSQTSTGKINTKLYVLTDPEGREHTTPNGLTDFCRKAGLTPANLYKVLKGERPNHKGWTIKKCQSSDRS